MIEGLEKDEKIRKALNTKISKNNYKSNKLKILKIIILLILITVTVTFLVFLKKWNFLPFKYYVAVISLIILTCLIVFTLMLIQKHIFLTIIGFVISAFVILGMIVSIINIHNTIKTIKIVTTPSVEVSDVSVFVLIDNEANDIKDAVNYKYGVIKSLDIDNTNQAIQEIEKKLNQEIKVIEFNGLVEIADALLNKEIDAMVMNVGFIEVYYDTEGHNEFPDQIRKLMDVKIQSDKKNDNNEKVELDKDFFVVYISGIDTEGVVSTASRSDVNIILCVNVKTKQVLLISTPRDYYVPLSISGGVKDKLTHAGIYGIDVSMDTLELLYDVDFDYYFRLNFTGFEKIIDDLGGVLVYSEYEFSNRGCSFSKGINNLNGKEALVFARERYAFTTGDNQRGINQMEVIESVINKATSPAILSNYNSILNNIKGNFETDISYDLISNLVKMQLNDNSNWNIVSYNVTGFDSMDTTYSMNQQLYVMIPNQDTVDKANDLIKQIREGKVLKND